MNTAEKIIIYQVFTRLFGNRNPRCTSNGSLAENGCGKMNDFTPQALKEIRKLGATHIWYTGVLAHATQTDYTKYGIEKNHPAVVKGKAGSPYAIRDYYDVDPDLAVNVRKRMGEFEALVERTHAAGLKMIIDFVPNHVARQYHSTAKPEGVRDLGEDDDTSMDFSPNNNFYYLPGQKLAGDVNLYDEQAGSYEEMPAKATGNNRFDAYPTPNDWYETVKLNYGVDFFHNTGCHFSPAPDTWHKMKDILLFWAGKGIDGFRCDMAEMVPCEFWGWAIPQVKAQYPELIFIAEVYNPNEYRNYLYNGHFDYLYDKVGLYDTLRAVIGGYASAVLLELDKTRNRKGKIITSMSLFLGGKNKYVLPENGDKPNYFEYNNGKFKCIFDTKATSRKIYFEGPVKGKKFVCDIDMDLFEDHESITIVTPFKKRGKFLPTRFFMTMKQNCMPAYGTVKLGDETLYTFKKEDTMCVLDWGRGVWPYRNVWYWGNGAKMVKGADGKEHMFGFEITWGIGCEDNATETCLFWDGKAHKIGSVDVETFPKGKYMQPWKFVSEDGRFNLTMTPYYDQLC